MTENDRLVVVGVDGTGSSTILLRWARDLALQLGARLHVVLAWRPPDLSSLVPFRVEVSLVETAERRLAELVKECSVGVTATSSVMEGAPSRVLLDSAKDADYLVIGRADGVDPSPSMSVASYCAMRSPCPVIIVPVRQDDAA